MLDYAAAQLPDQQSDDLGGALRMTLAQLNSAMHSGRWHVLLGATHTMDTPDGPRARVVTTTSDLMQMATGPITGRRGRRGHGTRTGNNSARSIRRSVSQP